MVSLILIVIERAHTKTFMCIFTQKVVNYNAYINAMEQSAFHKVKNKNYHKQR